MNCTVRRTKYNSFIRVGTSGLLDIFVDERTKKGLPVVLRQRRKGANERACASSPNDAITPEWLLEEYRMNSQAGEVALSVLDPVVLSSVPVIPFYTEPYTVGSIHLPYVSYSPDVT